MAIYSIKSYIAKGYRNILDGRLKAVVDCSTTASSLSKKVALCGLFCYNRTGDENAEKRNGTAAGNRNAVHGYAGTAGASFAEN